MIEVSANRVMALGTNAQGSFPRVLAVCSAGCLRSPTVAWVLSNEPFNFNTRSCGCEDYALIALDYALLQWAEYAIICAEDWQMWKVEEKLKLAGLERDVFSLGIPDDYDYRDPELVKLIMERCKSLYL